MRRFLLAVVVPVLACARILSYDEYEARGPAPIDSGVVDTAVEDVQPEVGDAGPPPARIPARPAGAAVASGKGKTLWLAVRTYTYGLTEPTGEISSTAWRAYGWDLDRTCTLERDSIENTNTCLRPAGAKQDSLLDGDRCRDNNFGRNISSLFGAVPDMEKSLNDLIRQGSTTWILRIDDVDDGADDPFASGALYRSSDDRTATPPPAWDGNDDRAVQSDSLVGGDLAQPALSFPRGYVAGGVWVSGDPAPLKVIAPISSVGFFPLDLQSALLTLELDATRTTGVHGLLVGALPAAEIEPMFKEVADFARVCPGTSLYVDTLGKLQSACDLVVGAPGLQDLEKTCDGLSTTVGFEVIPIQPVTRVVAPLTPRKPRCGDAG